MLFNSYSFLLFFPVVLLVYFVIPEKFKNLWLLISSYYFYMCWGPKYALILLFTTLSTYFCAIIIDKFANNEKTSDVEVNLKTEKMAETERNSNLEKIAEVEENSSLEKIAEVEENSSLEKIAEVEENSSLEKIAEVEENSSLVKNEEAKGRNSSNRAVKAAKIKAKFVLLLCIVSNLLVLSYFKYTNYIISILTKIFSRLAVEVSIKSLDIILPVGISFYIFQAVGYVIDVYRKTTKVEKNFVDYALFVSFFPQLVAGPIERSGNLIKQLKVHNKFDYNRARDGFLQMLWGYFLKMVIADKIAIYVDTVYGKYTTYGGGYLVLASALFALQIYCDFAGYSTIAIGAAKIIGVNLMENFKAPYLSGSVEEFWRNWHISLTTWFKDYLYIPLGGNRKGKIRKYINKVVVFSISGLWHGAGTSFVIWGALNGLYQVIGEILRPARNYIVKKFGLKTETISARIIKSAVTFVLVDITWVFFRASTTKDALLIIKSMCTQINPWIFFDGHIYECGLNFPNFMVLLLSIALLLFVDICRKKNICLREVICRQDFYIRWIFVAVSIVVILTFGAWGESFDAASFIYFQF